MRWITLALLLGIAPLSAAADNVPTPLSILQQAAALLERTERFSLHAEKTFDVILNDGAMVQYAGAGDLAYDENKGLFIDYGDDLSAKSFWYDGKTVTLLDELKKVYVSVPAEGSVSEVVQKIEARHGVRLPLAPLFRKNLAAGVEERMTGSRYLGINDVDGIPCHHLLFRGATEDWQLWVDTGDVPLIRKMVVNFHEIEGSPQQTLYLTDWELDTELPVETFAAELPEGAVRAEFVTAGGQ